MFSARNVKEKTDKSKYFVSTFFYRNAFHSFFFSKILYFSICLSLVKGRESNTQTQRSEHPLLFLPLFSGRRVWQLASLLLCAPSCQWLCSYLRRSVQGQWCRLPVLLTTSFTMKYRLQVNQAKPESPSLKSPLGWTGDLCCEDRTEVQ